MRLFVAIDLPSDILAALARLLARLRPLARIGVREERRHSRHRTLARMMEPLPWKRDGGSPPVPPEPRRGEGADPDRPGRAAALFTANADGKGTPAAVGLRIAADGSQSQLPVFHCGATCTPAPIDLGAESDQVILLLFGTGIRSGKDMSVRIGGLDAPVLGASAQGQFVGLDQVNVRLPRVLAGRGEVDLILTVDGKLANVVKIRVM